MTENIILIALAILPVMVLAMFVYKKDKFEKEPLRMLAKAFFFGCASVVPAILIEGALGYAFFYMGGEQVPGFVSGIYNGFIVAGCTEELCKLALLSLAVWKAPDFNEYFDGIVYATFVSLGFAGVENIMYVFNQSTFEVSLMTGGVRALLSVPGHFLFAVVMGYYFALAKFNPAERRQNLCKAFVYPMLLHGTFDALLMIPEAMGEEGSKRAFVHYPAGSYPGQTQAFADNTHFNPYGAYQIAKCVVEGLIEQGIGFVRWLRPEYPRGYNPAHPDNPADFHWTESKHVDLVKPDGN